MTAFLSPALPPAAAEPPEHSFMLGGAALGPSNSLNSLLDTPIKTRARTSREAEHKQQVCASLRCSCRAL
eukprot:5670295-Prymnesium_polylepis.2